MSSGAGTGALREWVEIACRGPVVRRALGFAVVVGAILIAINHGDALLRGELGSGRLLKMALTVIVPYTVSTLSSVGAMRERSSDDAGAGSATRDG
jgi:hypothetical protein